MQYEVMCSEVSEHDDGMKRIVASVKGKEPEAREEKEWQAYRLIFDRCCCGRERRQK